jgi:hypothetical protein
VGAKGCGTRPVFIGRAGFFINCSLRVQIITLFQVRQCWASVNAVRLAPDSILSRVGGASGHASIASARTCCPLARRSLLVACLWGFFHVLIARNLHLFSINTLLKRQ